MAGAVGEEIERVARVLVERGTVRQDIAQTVLQELRGAGASKS
jgi:hydroxymethylglutaryl-CoA reductase